MAVARGARALAKGERTDLGLLLIGAALTAYSWPEALLAAITSILPQSGAFRLFHSLHAARRAAQSA